MHKAALSLERNIVDRVTNTDNTAPEARVEKMFEYGYRKSNYGPDELVTDVVPPGEQRRAHAGAGEFAHERLVECGTGLCCHRSASLAGRTARAQGRTVA